MTNDNKWRKNKMTKQEKLPSFQKRHVKNPKRVRAALEEINMKHNWSWYDEILFRWKGCMHNTAIFYRGNEISGQQMFGTADQLAMSLKTIGIGKGDEILACMSNCPEAIYLLLAASKCGALINFFGSGFNENFIREIISDSSKKVFFMTNDEYEKIQHIVLDAHIDYKILIALNKSLPNSVDPYKEYDEGFSCFKNVEKMFDTDTSLLSFEDFLKLKKGQYEFEPVGIDDDFTITYTSGSTKIGLPKAIIHKNRAYISIARFHDPDLSRMPAMRNMRGLAHIPLHSNTNIASSISDTLCQKCTVACEPIYRADFFARSLAINKCSFVPATRSFWLSAIEDFKNNSRLAGEAIPLFVNVVAVGENITKNEEKYINKFFKDYKAGSAKLPFPLSPITLSIGGGNCEHGGLFFTLFKGLRERFSIGKKEFGLIPFQLADIAILDENKHECAFEKYGLLVANSPCTMKEYKDNPEATRAFYVTDSIGRIWGNCNVWAYITKKGNVVMRGRFGDEFHDNSGNVIPLFKIMQTISSISSDILSCETVLTHVDVETAIVSYIKYVPRKVYDEKVILAKIRQVCEGVFPYDVVQRMYIRFLSDDESFELTKSGKRNIRVLELNGIKGCMKL